MVIALAKYFGWPLDQLDVVTAFLYGVMKEVVYAWCQKGSNWMVISTVWNW
ncbi:hypothetical protein PI126_g18169 [Phytophthora idaei]|nr:hypothetical protein PI126_g18169 [Phytophthora idaei]